MLKELRGYKWEADRDGKQTEVPVKAFDHAMDAMRYAVSTHLHKQKKVTLT